MSQTTESPDARPAAAQHADGVEMPPPSLRRALLRIGPGLILAGAVVGTGELVATTNLGAKAGFALLWLVILSCTIKVFVQIELGRYAVCSGKTTLEAFRELPGPSGIVGWWWVLMMLSTQLQVAAIIGGVGYAMHMALPGSSPWLAQQLAARWPEAAAMIAAQPALPWAAGAAVLTAILLAGGGYWLLEKCSTLLVVLFTLATVLCVALLPAAGHAIDWPAVANGLTFRLPDIDGAVLAALAMFGITGVGATELVTYPYWCLEKGYARKTGPRDDSPQWAARARGWLRIMKLDAWLSMVLYTISTVAFYFLGAAVLHAVHDQGLPNRVETMLPALGSMYAPVMGSTAATWFIVVGAVAVLYSTLYAATGANSRALADFLRTNCGIAYNSESAQRRWTKAFCIALPLIDLWLFHTFKNPVMMVVIGGAMQALTLPILGAVALFLRYRRIDRRLVPGILWDLLLWLSVAGLFVAAAYGAWDSASRAWENLKAFF